MPPQRATIAALLLLQVAARTDQRTVVRAGSTATLPCPARPRPTSVSWYKDGELVYATSTALRPSSNWTGRALFKSGALRLAHVAQSDSGVYVCHLRFPDGTRRNFSHNLSVVGGTPPRIRSVGSTGPWPLGARLRLACLPPHGLTATELSWSPSDPALRERRPGNSTLLLEGGLQRRHQGTRLSCATRAGARAYFTIRLLLPPEGVQLVSTGPLVAGRAAELECVAWGSYPEPTFEWSLAGAPLPLRFVHWDGNVSTASTHLVALPGHHGRRLRCTARNALLPGDAALADEIVLRIWYAPTRVGVRPCPGTDDGCLLCEADANPPAENISWLPPTRGAPLATGPRFVAGPDLEAVRCTASNGLGHAVGDVVRLGRPSKSLGGAWLSIPAIVAATLVALCYLRRRAGADGHDRRPVRT